MNRSLDQYTFSTYSGFNSALIDLRYKTYVSYLKGKTCLELGCADGLGTKILLNYCTKVVAVDGAKNSIISLKKRIKDKKLTAIYSNFEKLKLSETFDVIMMGHILEHVNNPVSLLVFVKQFLAKNGIMIIDVPNAHSLHRQIGVILHMIPEEHALNAADRSIGHKRVYDMNLLKEDVERAGLKVTEKGGIFLKLLSNTQLEKILNKQLIQAFGELGKKYPDIAGEIYVVATR